MGCVMCQDLNLLVSSFTKIAQTICCQITSSIEYNNETIFYNIGSFKDMGEAGQ